MKRACSSPVSYTHLDVYKRQDLVEAAQNAMREMISRMQHQICDSSIIEDNMHQLVQALETVSYTHLDVYKRQMPHLPPTVCCIGRTTSRCRRRCRKLKNKQ